MTEDGCGLRLAGLAYLLDRAGQLLGRPWFQEYGGNPLGSGALRVETLMRATAQDDREVGPEPLEFARERHARHAGHGGVGDDEVKPSRRRPKRVEGDVAVGTADRLIPKRFNCVQPSCTSMASSSIIRAQPCSWRRGTGAGVVGAGALSRWGR